MATSGTYTYNPTMIEIIRRACRIIRAVRFGQVLQNEYINAAEACLQGMQKAWGAEGIKLWTYAQKVYTLTASSQVTNGGTNYKCVLSNTGTADNEPGTGSQANLSWIEGGDGSDGAWVLGGSYTSIHEITLDTNVIGVQYAFIREDEQDQPFLSFISKKDYDCISIKHTYARPDSACLDYATAKKLWLYPMPDDTDYIVVVQAMLRAMDTDEHGETTNYPPEWINAIVYGLASDLSDEYGSLNAQEKYRIDKKAVEYKKKAQSVQMPTEVDTPSSIVTGSFTI